jgi:hypothetical protein
MLMSPAVRDLVSKAGQKCETDETSDETSDETTIRFAILETHVKTNMCLRSFAWLRGPSEEHEVALQPQSALILNGTNVDVGLIVTFDEDRPAGQISDSIRNSRLLEAKGLTAGSLIFDFSGKSSYATKLDGLKFGRIHNNLANCVVKSEESNGKASGSSKRPQPPTVEQVVTWLLRNKNRASSKQPFTAFAEAFETIGEDATSLRVARASQELSDKTEDWWNQVTNQSGKDERFRATFLDTIPIAFQWGLRLVADHGYRPGKAVYGVLFTLGIFWLIFWFRLKIIAFETEPKADSAKPREQNSTQKPNPASRLLPVGFFFLIV